MAFIPGLQRLGETLYSDVRRAGHARDDTVDRQPELAWYMDRYPQWRDLYDGSALEEEISKSTDPAQATQKNYRWPVRFNLVASYCQLHAGMLWGRGRTGAESNDLFTVRVNPKVPYGPKPATELAPRIADLLNHFWENNVHVLRSNSIIQQWAGGCILKVTWNPASRNNVFGIGLETIQPEHFYPIWNPLNFEELYAVKLRFQIDKAVAVAKYNLTEREIQQFPRDRVTVEEYWDAATYYIVVGKENPDDEGVVARDNQGKPMRGPNPWIHPVTKVGIIPIHYIPRIRSGGFLGESLAYPLEGIQAEMNKTLSDYGDALTVGSHPAFGISDYKNKQPVIAIPTNGALNLGPTTPGGTPPKVHPFPLPQVPPQTGEFVDRLLSLSEAVAGLTPAARGENEGRDSGLALSLQMLPTINLVEWSRAHLSQAISGPGGINDTILTILWDKRSLNDMPKLGDTTTIFRFPQSIEFRPVVPRDRLEVINEVVQLATAEVVSPIELLRRLGDVENIPEELVNIAYWLAFKAKVEAAVAGRSLKVSRPSETENPARAWPQVSGETAEPAPKKPAKQPQGLANGGGTK